MNHKLLEKYWDAETTPQEEAQLLKEMEGKSGPEAGYFALIATARQQKSKLSIEDIKSYNQEFTPAQPSARVIPLYRWVASAAAVLLFAAAGVGLWNYAQQTTTPSAQIAETFEDPYEAYEEVRQALAFVSSKLNKSQAEAMTNIQKAGEYAEIFK